MPRWRICWWRCSNWEETVCEDKDQTAKTAQQDNKTAQKKTNIRETAKGFKENQLLMIYFEKKTCWTFGDFKSPVVFKTQERRSIFRMTCVELSSSSEVMPEEPPPCWVFQILQEISETVKIPSFFPLNNQQLLQPFTKNGCSETTNKKMVPSASTSQAVGLSFRGFLLLPHLLPGVLQPRGLRQNRKSWGTKKQVETTGKMMFFFAMCLAICVSFLYKNTVSCALPWWPVLKKKQHESIPLPLRPLKFGQNRHGPSAKSNTRIW